MEEIIEIKNATKRYKELIAVNNVSFDVKKGEIFALLGLNGAGKTTLIKMMTGLTSIDDGEINVLGKNVKTELGTIKEYLAVSPQESSVASSLSVFENIKFMADIYGIKNANDKTEELVKMFNLTSVKNKSPKKLSGGYVRRLSIAMALVSNPRVLFLDEPTLGLDVLVRRELWEIIKKISSQTTIVLTTHYMEEAEELSNRLAVMKEGHLCFVGTSKELIEKTGKSKFEDAFVEIVTKENI